MSDEEEVATLVEPNHCLHDDWVWIGEWQECLDCGARVRPERPID